MRTLTHFFFIRFHDLLLSTDACMCFGCIRTMQCSPCGHYGGLQPPTNTSKRMGLQPYRATVTLPGEICYISAALFVVWHLHHLDDLADLITQAAGVAMTIR